MMNEHLTNAPWFPSFLRIILCFCLALPAPLVAEQGREDQEAKISAVDVKTLPQVGDLDVRFATEPSPTLRLTPDQQYAIRYIFDGTLRAMRGIGNYSI